MSDRKETGMNDIPREQRAFTRVGFHTRAEVEVGGRTIHGEVSDISMNGMRMHTLEPATLGDACDVRIFLGETDPLVIRAVGHIARADGDGFAVRFDGLYCEAYGHLKQVVLFNSDDADKAEAEIESHIGIAPAPGGATVRRSEP
jgi:hypothetical protein